MKHDSSEETNQPVAHNHRMIHEASEKRSAGEEEPAGHGEQKKHVSDEGHGDPEISNDHEDHSIHGGHSNHGGHSDKNDSGDSNLLNQDHDQERHLNHDPGEHPDHDSAGHHDHHAMMVEDFKRRFYISLALTIPILILSPMIQMLLGVDWRFRGDSYILVLLSTILFIYGGKPFLTGARDELEKKSPGMMTLIAFAISVAYIYSTLAVFVIDGADFFWELATLIVIMLLGHWIEMRSVMGASRALDELLKLMPEEAHRIGEDGTTAEVPVRQLAAGDRVLVKPGEKIPIDGMIFEGASEVDEAMVTGESIPVDKGPGEELIGGSINGDGLLKFEVTKTGEATFLSQVIKLVQEAQNSKSKTQRLADTAAKWLFYLAVSAGTITFIYWMLSGQGLEFAMERAVTVIIISCPHALGLAIPLVTAVSTSLGAKRGLLIRNRPAFENARKVDAVVFDKTGTLTMGEFGVDEIVVSGIDDAKLIALTAAVEANSEHPIARGITREAQQQNIRIPAADDFRNLPGRGLTATVNGQKILIGSPGMLRHEGISFDEEHHEKLTLQGKTVVYVLADDVLIGSFALSDMVRESSREAIEALHDMGIESIMLTGDNQNAADFVGRQLGIDRIFAEVLPEEKSAKIKALQAQGKVTAMTGDGINDAPSLATADLGIAIGAGTDVAIETADIILVRSDPQDVVHIIQLSKATYRKMVQNLIWATAYNVIALPLAAGVLYKQGILISPAMGAVFMSLSTIIVAINARILKMPVNI